MKKKYVFLVLGFVLIIFCYMGIHNAYKLKEIKEDEALKNTIIKTVQKSNEIDFGKITNFQWDAMYIFPPYSNPNNILKKDGIKSYNSSFNIEVLDTINMIGFVKANKLVALVNLPRNYGGLNLLNYIRFNKEEAKFTVLQDKKSITFEKDR